MIPGKTRDGRLFVRPDNPKSLQSWRSDVSNAAAAHVAQHGKVNGAVSLRVVFRFGMPKSRSKGDRSWGLAWRTGTPDLDKLVRAVGDALKSGGMYGDDAQIAYFEVWKIEAWESWTGALIQVGSMPLLCRLDADGWPEMELS